MRRPRGYAKFMTIAFQVVSFSLSCLAMANSYVPKGVSFSFHFISFHLFHSLEFCCKLSPLHRLAFLPEECECRISLMFSIHCNPQILDTEAKVARTQLQLLRRIEARDLVL